MLYIHEGSWGRGKGLPSAPEISQIRIDPLVLPWGLQNSWPFVCQELVLLNKPCRVFPWFFRSFSPQNVGGVPWLLPEILPHFPSPKDLEQIHFAPCISWQVQVEMFRINPAGLVERSSSSGWFPPLLVIHWSKNDGSSTIGFNYRFHISQWHLTMYESTSFKACWKELPGRSVLKIAGDQGSSIGRGFFSRKEWHNSDSNGNKNKHDSSTHHDHQHHNKH